jgi:N-ATPase, AtpR subunit
MIHNSLTLHSELTFILALAGFALGLAYFVALKRSVALFVGGKGWFRPLALTLGRVGAAAGFLFVAAKLGAAPLLAAFIGFLTARALALRAERRAG